MCEQFNESAFRESDLLFWSNQISKQLHYIEKLLSDCSGYKEKAKIIFDKWEKFLVLLPVTAYNELFSSTHSNCNEQNASVFYDFERVRQTKADYLATDRNINNFNLLIDVSKRFVESLLITVTNSVTNYDDCPKVWIGSIYPTQLESFLISINYARKKVNCDIFCDKTTIKFWNVVLRDNLYTVIHQLDPSEHELIRLGYRLACRLYREVEKNENCKDYEEKSVKYSKKVDRYFRTIKCLLVKNNVRSVIYPLQLTVYIRYVQRALRDQTWIYCKTRHRCCPGLEECCTKYDSLIKFEGKEGNKCCKSPKPIDVKCCD